MFVPLHDENTLKSIRFQFVTIGLIAVNVFIYFFQELTGFDTAQVASFALVPKELFDTSLLPVEAPDALTVTVVPERLTLFSYMFFHGDILHLAGNMLFLWVFGDNVEDSMGHLRFLAFYLACGVFAGLTHALIAPDSDSPLIGASGAVAGVIAAYLMLHPRVRVWVLALKAIPLRISAAFALGLWILMQLFMAALPLLGVPDVGPVAWWAHIGGLIAGAVLVVFLRRPGVPLFDKRLGTA
jgi:membrane associated rhomboid family serine protease